MELAHELVLTWFPDDACRIKIWHKPVEEIISLGVEHCLNRGLFRFPFLRRREQTKEKFIELY